MTPPRALADGVDRLLWESRALVIALIGPDLRIASASPHLDAVMGRAMAGEPAASLVTECQVQALANGLRGAGPEWTDMVLGLDVPNADAPLDYRIRVASRGHEILLVGEPAVMDRTTVDEQLLQVAEDLISEQRRISMDRDRLDRMARTDPLTRLGNRRRLDTTLGRRLAAASSTEPVSVVFADIDRFKAINDTFGHTAGDAVLRFVAEVLRGTCRAGDVVARYGGEEFVAVLPRTDVEGAGRWAERARSALASRLVPELGRPVTASFGVAEHRPGEAADELLARADAALYAAKQDGRNRVARATQPGEDAPVIVSPAPPGALAVSPAPAAFVHAPRLSEVLWQSSGIGVAEFDADGRLVSANGAFARLVGEGLEGRRIAELVVPAQAEAMRRYVADAGPDWVRGAFALATGRSGGPADRILWLRRTDLGLDLLVDVDPDPRESTQEPLLGLVDDLIEAQRALTRTHLRLQRALDDLDAASREVRRLQAIGRAADGRTPPPQG